MTKPKKRASPSEKTTSVPAAGGRSSGADGSKSPTPKAPAGRQPGAISPKVTIKSNGQSKNSASNAGHPLAKSTPGKSGGTIGSKRPVAKGATSKTPAPRVDAAKNSPSSPTNSVSAKPQGVAKSGLLAGVKGASVESAPPAAPLIPRKLPKGGPTKADLKRYRDHLLTLRKELLVSSRDLEAEVLKSSGANSSVDHMADNGSDNYEQDFSLKLLEGEGRQLAEIRDALLKIDGKLDPPFGVCEPCVDEDLTLCPTCPYIPAARLDAMPHARMCVQTKELEEKRRG